MISFQHWFGGEGIVTPARTCVGYMKFFSDKKSMEMKSSGLLTYLVYMVLLKFIMAGWKCMILNGYALLGFLSVHLGAADGIAGREEWKWRKRPKKGVMEGRVVLKG